MPRAKTLKPLLVKPAEPLLCHHLPASSTGWHNPSSTAGTKRHREVFVQRRCTGIKIKAERPGSSRPAPSPPPLPEGRPRAAGPAPTAASPERARPSIRPSIPPPFPALSRRDVPRPRSPARAAAARRASSAGGPILFSAGLGCARRLRRGLKGSGGGGAGGGPRRSCVTASPRRCRPRAPASPLLLLLLSLSSPAAPSPPEQGNFLTGWASRARFPFPGNYHSRPARSPTNTSKTPLHPPAPPCLSKRGKRGFPASFSSSEDAVASLGLSYRQRMPKGGGAVTHPSNSFHKESLPRFHTLFLSKPLQVLLQPFPPARVLSLPLPSLLPPLTASPTPYPVHPDPDWEVIPVLMAPGEGMVLDKQSMQYSLRVLPGKSLLSASISTGKPLIYCDDALGSQRKHTEIKFYIVSFNSSCCPN